MQLRMPLQLHMPIQFGMPIQPIQLHMPILQHVSAKLGLVPCPTPTIHVQQYPAPTILSIYHYTSLHTLPTYHYTHPSAMPHRRLHRSFKNAPTCLIFRIKLLTEGNADVSPYTLDLCCFHCRRQINRTRANPNKTKITTMKMSTT